jgi:ABC-2 type transport system permease protein
MVAMATVFGSLLWLLTAAFISGEAAARDVATGMHPLTYTLPITKAQYLGGRFLAAFVLHAFILLFVQATLLLAVYLPGVHPDSIGPFRPEAFLTAYFFIALPNAFAAAAIQFALALQTGRPIVAYFGSLLAVLHRVLHRLADPFQKRPWNIAGSDRSSLHLGRALTSSGQRWRKVIACLS